MESDADERGHVHPVADNEVRSLLQSSDETEQKDLVADELTEQRQAVVQTALTTGTVLRAAVQYTTQPCIPPGPRGLNSLGADGGSLELPHPTCILLYVKL